MFQVKIDCVEAIEDCPIFNFDDFQQMVKFIELCFANDYEVLIRKA
jgi:hypothetical protein